MGFVICNRLLLNFSGSARRKLTCTICNRKCSSSLNLQEHRKVRLPQHLLHGSVNPRQILCIGSARTYSARAVLHVPFLQRRLFGAVFSAARWYPSYSTVSVTQSNLSIAHFPLLHMLLSSLIPSLWSSCCKCILGDTEQRDGFFFTSSSHRSCEI